MKAAEINKLRRKLMLNQQEFADLIEVKKGTVSRWERALQGPRAVHLRRMARLLKEA